MWTGVRVGFSLVNSESKSESESQVYEHGVESKASLHLNQLTGDIRRIAL